MAPVPTGATSHPSLQELLEADRKFRLPPPEFSDVADLTTAKDLIDAIRARMDADLAMARNNPDWDEQVVESFREESFDWITGLFVDHKLDGISAEQKSSVINEVREVLAETAAAFPEFVQVTPMVTADDIILLALDGEKEMVICLLPKGEKARNKLKQQTLARRATRKHRH